MTTEDILELVDQAEPRLRRLSNGNHLFEMEDLRQTFAEAVIRQLSVVKEGPDAPSPPRAFLYKHGLWGVLHYIRNEAHRGLRSYCDCGWSGSYRRQCPWCDGNTTSVDRNELMEDSAYTNCDFGLTLDTKRLTVMEKKVLWLVVNGGPQHRGYWDDIAQTLGVSRTRISQLWKHVTKKLEGWDR